MNPMRKISALALVALLAMSLAVAVMGCAKKTEEAATPATTSETTTETVSPESTMADTSMHQ